MVALEFNRKNLSDSKVEDNSVRAANWTFAKSIRSTSRAKNRLTVPLPHQS